MKFLFIAALAILSFSCGTKDGGTPLANVPAPGGGGGTGKDGTSCTVIDSPEGAVVKCSDGTTATVKDGAKGATGATGAKGDIGATGAKGDIGATGAKGSNSKEYLAEQIGLVKQYEGSVIDIECNNGRGSGFKVSGKIYTAKHVIDSATTCSFWSGLTRIDTGAAISWTQKGTVDLVELTVVFNASGTALLNIPIDLTYSPKLGDLQLNLSYPEDLNDDVQYTSGFVVDENVNKSLSGGTYATLWYNAWTTDYAAAGGSSGSPVFVDGKVVGVHVGGYATNGLELNYTIPVK